MLSFSIPARRGMIAVLLVVGFVLLFAVSSARAEFGFTSFSSTFEDLSGTPVTQAGSHTEMVTAFDFNTTLEPSGRSIPDEQPRDVVVDLPVGFYGNPRALPKCDTATLTANDGACRPAAQVGLLSVPISAGGPLVDFPVYNMVSASSQTAVLGAAVFGALVKIVVSVRTDGDYGLQAKVSNINQGIALWGQRLTLWGVPADPVHDPHRLKGLFQGGLSAGIPLAPFISLPARCGPVTTSLRADSWQHPGVWIKGESTTTLTGCDRLRFEPSITARPEVSMAGAPTGFDVHVSLPQDESVNGLATPALRKAVVALPVGVTVSPGSASGLGACSDAQLALGTKDEPSCPDSSKVGTVSIVTPVLDDPVAGDVVLGTQEPGQLLRLFFVVRGPGLLFKVPGVVVPDPVTGQLVATFDDAPQLPFSDLAVSFKSGPRAALSNPKACGTYTTHGSFTPWSGGATVEAQDSFVIDRGCDLAGRFEPSLDAGVTNPVAGGQTGFVLNLSRPSGEQDIGGLSVVLPPGVLARVGSVPLCGDAQAAAGTCSPASQIGSTTVGVGAGSSPLFVPEAGKAPTAVYLAGPYKGAPFSLSVVVPAQAGPFDLGTVVVRAALFVDRTDAHATVVSDPLPTILQGIPLDMQKLNVTLDRPGFMVNPTSCAPMSIAGTVTSSQGLSVGVGSRFQVGECSSLGFAPRFSASTKAKSTRANGAALDVKIGYPAGRQANIRRVAVSLPKQLPSRLKTIQHACLAATFAVNPGSCDPSSLIGTAKASTPLLSVPLSGPAYLVSHGGAAFPDLVMVLQGQGITLDVVGAINISKAGVTSATFARVPDAPISGFELTLPQGPHSALTGLGDLCAKALTMPTAITAQNGALIKQATKINVTGCPKKKRHKAKKA